MDEIEALLNEYGYMETEWDYFMAIPTKLAAQIISENYTLIKKGD